MDFVGKTHHCVFGAKVVDDEGTANSPRHIKQATQKLMCGTMGRPSGTYLMTVAQPNTTLSEVLPPVILQRD